MKSYILSIDQGTTSTRAILVDKTGKVIQKAQREVHCTFPAPGFVRQDPEEIWISVVDVINDVLIRSNVSFSDIACLGIATQRETTIVFEKATGKAVFPAIVWQGRDSLEVVKRYEKYEDFLKAKTGLRLDPYFSASKIRYILEQDPTFQARAEAGELLFGTVETFLIYRMTKGKSHVTDITNASRTLLFNIHTLTWDDELLKLFNIPRAMLPEVKENVDMFGHADFFNHDLIITGVAGDQQAALFGEGCFKKGDSKNTYGTGCFMLMNTGDKVVDSKHGLLSTVAWKINGQVTYALEGSVFIGGAVVQYVRDQLGWIKSSSDSEMHANKVSDSNGIYFVPSFTGLGTPYWDEEARGAIVGLTRGVSRHHITRAALESIAYQSRDVFDIMKKEAKLKLKVLKADGGASQNNLLMQFQSDILGVKVGVQTEKETTALGAAYLASIYTHFFDDLESLIASRKENIFTPKLDKETREKKYRGWKTAVKATRAFKTKDI